MRGLFLASILLCLCVLCNADPKNYAVMTSVSVSDSPPAITIDWSADKCTPTIPCLSFTVQRKIYNRTYIPEVYYYEWFDVPSTQLSNTSTRWVDTNVTVGVMYQYKVSKQSAGYSTSRPNNADTTILSGIKVPMADFNGIVLFVVEQSSASILSDQLKIMEENMIGDGWRVTRVTVLKNETASQVKTKIVAAYNRDPINTKSLYIFGDVAVPYSGYQFPDGHSNHYGAWPADMYYADVVGGDAIWTDKENYTPNTTEAKMDGIAARQWNVPGDGKFDNKYSQTMVMELEIGRVDLADFSAKNETTLLSNYITKNHNFRHGITQFTRRAAISDGFGDFGGEAFAQSGWRTFTTLVGPQNILTNVNSGILQNASTTDYLFFYGTGGGGPSSMGGVGGTGDYAKWAPKIAFTMQFGSYFGDWDVRDNFLKAPLAYGSALTDVWGARPEWDMYYVSLGLPVGRAAFHTMNFNRQVYMALMGDPTLRVFVVRPVANVTATQTAGTAKISWIASPDSGLAGHHIYRAASSNRGVFERLTTSFVTGTSWTDSSPLSGSASYMVRAVKLEITASGSYYNPSQGIFTTLNFVPPPTTSASASSSTSDTSGSSGVTSSVGSGGTTGGTTAGGTSTQGSSPAATTQSQVPTSVANDIFQISLCVILTFCLMML